jgi:hypothetical protein
MTLEVIPETVKRSLPKKGVPVSGGTLRGPQITQIEQIFLSCLIREICDGV